ALIIALIALAIVAVIYIWSNLYTRTHQRKMQHALGKIVDPTRKTLLHREHSEQHYKPEDVTSYFWVNGYPPEGEDFKRLAENDFAQYTLEICGMVEQPLSLSLLDLRKLGHTSQITKHNCIQGWSAVGQWAGVQVTTILEMCRPLPDAKYLVFTSYQRNENNDPYYEVIDFELAKHSQTILAYEMNGAALPREHGAPLRLRVETELGYKMVKYLRSIECVKEYTDIGEGQGGYREDVQFYGHGAEI
ncbi:MAG: molybdopterin-dependent oxidoreductase, partial [Chloroflexota bacterium]|nr:molybdopterin-dependent oxidoreductase [Chloroflexota bacterium]